MINKKLVIAGVAVSAALLAGCKKDAPKVDDAAKLQTLEQKASYIIGQNMASSLKQNSITFDSDAFMLAINDVKAGTPERISKEDAQKIMQELQEKVMKQKQEEQKKLGEENGAKGEKFLTENKAKEGVKVTESGLQYKVITEGSGVKPKSTDTVSVHYVGKLVDGTEFDSSRKHGDQPVTFPVTGVIPGWTEALQLMPQGSKWELYIPAKLAYGENGQGPIPPNSTLVFEVELLEVKAASAAEGADAKPAKGKK